MKRACIQQYHKYYCKDILLLDSHPHYQHCDEQNNEKELWKSRLNFLVLITAKPENSFQHCHDGEWEPSCVC